jgi:CHAT domain-containing protein
LNGRRIVKSRSFRFAGVVITAVAGWSACRSGPDPAALVAEADSLRSRFEETASLEAVEKYLEAAAAFERRGDPRGAVKAMLAAGTVRDQLGAPKDALERYDNALALARSAGAPLLESAALSEVGIAEANLSRFESALRQCRAALDLALRSGGTREEARARTCLGEVDYLQFRDHRSALAHYQSAEPLWRRAGDRRGEGWALLHQGWVHSDLRELDSAQACFDRARAAWASAEDRRGAALLAVAGAKLEQRRGRYQEALNRYREAIPLLRSSGDAVWFAATLTGVADVYLQVGDTAAALEHWRQALQVFEAAGLGNTTIDVLIALGATYLAAGDDENALDCLRRADDLTARQGNQRWRANALRYLAVVDLLHRQPHQARARLEQSLEIQRSLGDAREPGLAARTSADMGDTCLMLGDNLVAVRWFGEALATSRASVNRVEEARALFGLGRASAAVNDLDAARAHLLASMAVVESLRTAVENRDLRTSFFASLYRYHESYLDVLMRLDRLRPERGLAAAAFEANERARARTLLESLLDARVDLRAGVGPELAEKENRVRRALDVWADRQRQLSAARMSEADAQALRQKHRDLEDRYAQVQAEVRRSSPRYAALAQPQPLSLRDIQRQILDANTLLLEYALGEERSYLWAVSRKDHSSYVLPPRAQIEELAGRVYAGMADGGRTAAGRAEADARQLSEVLLGPVARRIAGKRLLVVADGALQYVPFAALPVPGRAGEPVPMVVEHEIVSLPSASVLAVLRREAADRTVPSGSVAVFADPVFEADDPRERAALRTSGGPRPPEARAAAPPAPPRLLSTREEAAAVVEAAPPGTSLKRVGFDASRTAARDPELGRYRIVHFATHGVFDNQTPGQSGIELSLYGPDGQARAGLLSLQDIYTLRLPVELVVLSACSTALGKPVRGEGLVGTVRGFMYAGARRVVASLWKVEDDATRELMRQFYVGMLRDNLPPAAALRRAQLAMRQHDRWRAPFYWAAFVLQGEWE